VRTSAIAVLESIRKTCSLYEQLRTPAPPAALAAIGTIEQKCRKSIASIDASTVTGKELLVLIAGVAALGPPLAELAMDLSLRAYRKRSASRAATAKQNQPRSKSPASPSFAEARKQIRATYATGKYDSRDECAEQESQRLGISVDTARRYLRNATKPPRA
jgi:hypothetical protein